MQVKEHPRTSKKLFLNKNQTNQDRCWNSRKSKWIKEDQSTWMKIHESQKNQRTWWSYFIWPWSAVLSRFAYYCFSIRRAKILENPTQFSKTLYSSSRVLVTTLGRGSICAAAALMCAIKKFMWKRFLLMIWFGCRWFWRFFSMSTFCPGSVSPTFLYSWSY